MSRPFLACASALALTLPTLATAAETQLTNETATDARPAWCPDNISIAFDSDRAGNRDLWMIPVGGGTATQLTTNLELDQHPDWSPGCILAFSASVGGGNPDLYLLDPQVGTPVLLHSDPGSVDRFPAWSPDSSTIAYSKDNDIYLIPATGGTPVQVTTDPGTDLHPTWSPDGTQLAFLSNRSGNNDIWVIPATSRARRRWPGPW
ncbi:DPP IV N-terminal domain-containing protein [bacterium]|nr:DPP IV N-terminal domain-containing protein [bacterium]